MIPKDLTKDIKTRLQSIKGTTYINKNSRAGKGIHLSHKNYEPTE